MKQQSINRRAFLASCAALGAAGGIPGPAWAQAAVSANVQLDATPSGKRVLAEFLGLSFDASLIPGGGFLTGSNSDLVNYVRSLGRGVLHIGGSSLSSTTFAAADLKNLAGFANAAGWRIVLGLNVNGPPFGVGQQATLAQQALGDRLVAFELSAGDSTLSDYTQYLAAYRELHRSIAANAPGSSFAGPGVLDHEDWIERFVADARNGLVMITTHYRHLAADANQVEALGRTLSSTATGVDLPFRITRVESAAQNSIAAALWTMDFAFRMAQNGSDGINVADSGKAERTPVYSGLQLLAESVDAPLVPVHVTTTLRDLTVYAVQRSNGSRAVTIINRSEEQPASVSIQTGVAAPPARVRRLSAVSLQSTQAFLGGWSAAGTGAIDVPPGSAAVVTT